MKDLNRGMILIMLILAAVLFAVGRFIPGIGFIAGVVVIYVIEVVEDSKGNR